ncbi:MAG TPA: methanogen output domain 1-containing protein [Vitreimonas sp.]|uniref:helix-turn-helix transcriptional regulator n=1 Tax=Vitreimonas sp. TaxID=3069702 RepID=UPI002D54D906|nr:methanogen output domain 1-containing protein [Vitreimonas sp.]HYD88980.1 methanogen output domain 1-containing protein [Vitreimonas sp.]
MLDAFGQRQRDLLNLLLQQKDGLTIDQMASSLGITRSAVREHVSALERDRLIAGGPLALSTGGRPGRRYALTDRGLALFPKQYDLMARLLLESLTQRLGGAEAERELRSLGSQLGAQTRAKVGAGNLSERARAAAEVMRELGYQSSVREDATPSIEALNCVFHELARRNPSVCALDLSLIETITDARVEHRACMARGDNACVFCLAPKDS